VWWIVFSAVDLYVGFVAIGALMPSLPAEKQRRATIAKKVVLVLLVVHVVALAGILIKRWMA
jgi:hypothetical protein